MAHKNLEIVHSQETSRKDIAIFGFLSSVTSVTPEKSFFISY